MKKLFRDVIATAIGITVYVGGSVLAVLFLILSITIAQTFSPWTLLLTLPVTILLFSLVIVSLNHGLENADELLLKLDKLMGLR
jgi:Mg/Co/Ni transporter MgtE